MIFIGLAGAYTVSRTAPERVQDQKARRKRGRPRVGGGARRVLVTLESSLLRRSDLYADKHGLSRSALIARGLEELLGKKADTQAGEEGTAELR